MQISVQIRLNWNWPTGTELGNMDHPVKANIPSEKCMLDYPVCFNGSRKACNIIHV